GRAPLMRATLMRLGEREHVLAVVMHHIISDEWSMQVLIEEMTELYRGLSGGEQRPMAKLPIQYADYAVWQRQWLAGKEMEKQLAYWKKQLGGELPVLELPTDKARPAVQSDRGAEWRFALGSELSSGVKEMSRRERVTFFMVLLAAYKALLYRYTGQRQIVIGTPIANRNRAQVEALIGFFVNTMVLKTEVEGEKSCKELLRRVKDISLAGYTHQDVPFEKLVEEIQPERELSRSPLFQVMFVLQQAPKRAKGVDKIMLDSIGVERETAKFDVTLFIEERREELVGLLEYSTDLFEEETMRRMAEHYRRLLEEMVANPARRVDELEFLSESERHQLLEEWNDTDKGYAQDRCVHELFEQQVGCAPDAVAVVYEGAHLSYRGLNGRANRLAHYLREMGVGPEVFVGVCLGRGLETV